MAHPHKKRVENVPKMQVHGMVYRARGSTPNLKEWWKVAICEEGGKKVNGPVYAGYLGIRRSVWAEFGGLHDYGPEQNATFAENVIVAQRINGSYVPDQTGCSAW